MVWLTFCMAMFVGQLQLMQNKQVVHLPPHRDAIQADFAGKLLELERAPAIVHLPANPPSLDSRGAPWAIDIKNLGPDEVTLLGQLQFVVRLKVGQSVRIAWKGTKYSLANKI